MRTGWAIAMALWMAGCETEDPCQEYVDYVCQCHDGEEGYDCEELRATYADPDPELQNQCELDRAALEQQDQENGVECAA
jgi:hypothetical protein